MSYNTDRLAITVSDKRGTGESTVEINTYPDICPICKKGMQPLFKYGCLTNGRQDFDPKDELQAVFQCTIGTCKTLFVGYYSEGYQYSFYLEDAFRLQYVKVVDFPETIQKISPRFKRIYNQAYIAEENKLDEIAGGGFRKALEFLVKDFLIHEDGKISEQVKKELLGASIGRINDPNIKACASRASWLGNDETHYERKWEDKDIQDLKILIKLTVNWVESILLTRRYKKDMQSKDISQKDILSPQTPSKNT